MNLIDIDIIPFERKPYELDENQTVENNESDDIEDYLCYR